MTYIPPRGILKYMTNQELDDQIINKLKRVRGQIDGLIKMYSNERSCIDITRQIIAARNSLGRIARDMFNQEAARCSKEKRISDLDQLLKEILKY